MVRVIRYFYGLACYAVCFATCIYAVGFMADVAVPKTMDSGQPAPTAEAFAANVVLLAIFAAQHSVMARRPFKRWLAQFVPAALERSTYVLCSSLALALLFWQWRPMPELMWRVGEPTIAIAVKGVAVFGWVVVRAMFTIKHFELFGLHPAGRSMAGDCFRSPLLGGFARHPIYLGFIVAFWVTPTMTAGHMLFAAMMTAYIMAGMLFEERELALLSGGDDRRYRDKASIPVPWRRPT